MEDAVERGHDDDDLQHDGDGEHAHEDCGGEDAFKDVVLVQDLAAVDLVEHLHEDEGVEQQALARHLVFFLDVVVEASGAIKRIEDLRVHKL